MREQAAACLQSGEESGVFFPNCGCKDTCFFESETIFATLFSPVSTGLLPEKGY
jgi:hypothetical protein